MLGQDTQDKIILSMSRMAGRGIAEFTNEQLSNESGYHPKTVRLFIRDFNNIHIAVSGKGKPARNGITSTYRWLTSAIKVPKREHVSAKELAKKWAGYCVDPEISSLGDFTPIGNVYHYR